MLNPGWDRNPGIDSPNSAYSTDASATSEIDQPYARDVSHR